MQYIHVLVSYINNTAETCVNLMLAWQKAKVTQLRIKPPTYTVNAEIFIGGVNFHGKRHPQKLNTRKFVHTNNSNSN